MPNIFLSKRNLGIHSGAGHIGVHTHVSAHVDICIDSHSSSIHIHVSVHASHSNIHVGVHSSVVVHVGVHSHTAHVSPHLHIRPIHVDVHVHSVSIVCVSSGDLVVAVDWLHGLHVDRGGHVVVDDDGLSSKSTSSRSEATPLNDGLRSAADASVVEAIVSQPVTLADMAAFGINQSEVFWLATPPRIDQVCLVAPSAADSTVVVPPAITDETLTHFINIKSC